MFINSEIFIVEVPKDSIEYAIDDFLGNTLQYKIDNKWEYNTSIKIPHTRNLSILGILENNEYIDLNIDRAKKWLKIKVK